MQLTYIVTIASLLIAATTQAATPRLKWKTKPHGALLVHESESVTLGCEFELAARSEQSANNNYFVIWYKGDDASSNNNVISLNDQLSSKTNSTYQINGTYNLLIRNVTRHHAGIYTCQLFQSDDMVASVNLTVLGKALCAHV